MNPVEFRLEILLDLYSQSLKRGTLRTKFSDEFIEKYQLNTCEDIDELDECEDESIDDDNESINKLFVFNLEYLENKGYLDITWGAYYEIFDIFMTSYGIDVSEFALYGRKIDEDNPDSKFQKLLSSIVKSGMNVLEGSAVGLVNIAIQNLLK